MRLRLGGQAVDHALLNLGLPLPTLDNFALQQ